MEGLKGTEWKLSSQQKLWWRQLWRIKLCLTLELSLLLCLCPLLVPNKSNQEAARRESWEVKHRQFPVLLSPSQQAVRHLSVWSVSCCSLKILSYLWTSQKRFTHWHSLQYLYPAPVHTMTEKQFFWCSFLHAPLSTCVTGMTRSCGKMESSEFLLAPAFKPETQRNPSPFQDIVCHEKHV